MLFCELHASACIVTIQHKTAFFRESGVWIALQVLAIDALLVYLLQVRMPILYWNTLELGVHCVCQ